MEPIILENLVAGQWRRSATTIDVLDPADLRVTVARMPAMSADEVRAGIDGAAKAVATWRSLGHLQRAAVLRAAAVLLRERREEIATDLTHEMGKTTAEAAGEVGKAADFFDYYAGLARTPLGYSLADERPGVGVSVRFEPVGVVVAITPWNDPLLTPARKIAPALAAGNAIILKPATETPTVAWHLARVLDDAGIPAGVFTTVTGRGSDISGPLLGDERIAAVTFTGSTSVGLKLRRQLAGRNIRLQTEMGGKNASVVLADADVELAASTIATAGFAQAGQRCTATSRVIVDAAVADDVLERLVSIAEAMRLGAGSDPGTTMGPMVSASQRDDVLAHIEAARADGARLRTGGGPPGDVALKHSCLVEPTVFVDVEPTHRIWREEVFGPVLAVRVVDGFDEAIAAVNDSDYGLSAAVFTCSLDLATRFQDEVDTGQVSVNLSTSGWDVHQPFGGFRLSGSSFKEQGMEALHFFSRTKACAVKTSARMSA